MEQLTVKIKYAYPEFSGTDVDARVYDSKGNKVMDKRSDGSEYHMGQISK